MEKSWERKRGGERERKRREGETKRVDLKRRRGKVKDAGGRNQPWKCGGNEEADWELQSTDGLSVEEVEDRAQWGS